MPQPCPGQMRSAEEAIQEVLLCLRVAGAKIAKDYVRLPTADLSYLTHERTYCYELYHRLRECLGDTFEFHLMGEVDKPVRWVPSRVRPDLIIHVPGLSGRAGGNLVAMEVKPLRRASPRNLLDDINKLRSFTTGGLYLLGVLLVYDYRGDSRPPSVVTRTRELIRRGREERIVVAWHSGPGKEIEVVP